MCPVRWGSIINQTLSGCCSRSLSGWRRWTRSWSLRSRSWNQSGSSWSWCSTSTGPPASSAQTAWRAPRATSTCWTSVKSSPTEQTHSREENICCQDTSTGRRCRTFRLNCLGFLVKITILSVSISAWRKEGGDLCGQQTNLPEIIQKSWKTFERRS